MVLKKCAKCNKNITKKVPGLECSRCDKIVHADPGCSKLSNKQLNTLKNSTGIEWSCEECLKNVSRRSSFVIPEDDGEDDESESGTAGNAPTINTRKLVQDISRELKKTFREEIGSLEASLEFLSDQITTMDHSIKKQDSKIKSLENKNLELQNKNRNLELRMSALEQGMNTFEQKTLSTTLEVAGLPILPPAEVDKALGTIVSKLNMDGSDILNSRRLPGTKEKPGPIQVELKSLEARRQWVAAGKEKRLTVGLLIPDAPKEKADSRVFIREALTKNLKTLLYTTKTQLKSSFQFIWCKDGKICVRKSSDSKIYYIRSIQDIYQIEKQSVTNKITFSTPS